MSDDRDRINRFERRNLGPSGYPPGKVASPVVIENPILNSPYKEPSLHFRFDENGITNDIVEERRPSSYFVAIPPTKRTPNDETESDYRYEPPAPPYGSPERRLKDL